MSVAFLPVICEFIFFLIELSFLYFFLLLNIIPSWPPHSLLLSPTPIEEHRWQSLSNRIAWNLPTSMSGINLVLTKRTYQHSTTEQPACPKTVILCPISFRTDHLLQLFHYTFVFSLSCVPAVKTCI